MKIIDCFLFFNEIDMLLFRLKELDNYVDKFVIVESNWTFSGNAKKLYYYENKDLFAKYEHKIEYVNVVEMKLDKNSWEREASQRNAIEYGLNNLNLNDNDLIIISDCDEIPNTKVLEVIRIAHKIFNYPYNIYSLEQDFYYYNLTSKKTVKWSMSRIVHYQIIKDYCTPQQIRHYHTRNYNYHTINFNHHTIINGGWHFSYFASPEKIRTKIESFSHTEFDDEKYKHTGTILKNIELKQDLFFRSNEEIINCEINESELPKNYRMLLDIK